MAARHGDTGSERAASRDPAGLMLTWLDAEAGARVICADDLVLLWANRAARAEMEGDFDLVERDGAMVILDRAHHARFSTLVSEAGEDISTFSFPRQNGDGHLLFRARRIENRATRCVGLAFNQTGSEFRVLYGELSFVFRLTAAEHRLLDRMIAGHTADGIARTMQISLDTVRSHIRHIYQKLDVTSREELFSRLLPYRL
jgi:DNA-binding CsgD family transcriptional regulator